MNRLFTPKLPMILGVLLASAIPALAGPLLEPRLTIPPGTHHGSRVALTLDACSGKADERILKALIGEHIPATIFATARWLAHNAPATAEIKAHPELFEVENHGARHLPAVDRPMRVYGIPAAGSPEALRAEISGGAKAVKAAFGNSPRWYRGATGKYTASAIALVHAMSYQLAGYSMAADGGARLGAPATARHIEAAKDGDVILAHMNQPDRPAGEGVVEGVLALKAKGFRFVTLNDAIAPGRDPVLTH